MEDVLEKMTAKCYINRLGENTAILTAVMELSKEDLSLNHFYYTATIKGGSLAPGKYSIDVSVQHLHVDWRKAEPVEIEVVDKACFASEVRFSGSGSDSPDITDTDSLNCSVNEVQIGVYPTDACPPLQDIRLEVSLVRPGSGDTNDYRLYKTDSSRTGLRYLTKPIKIEEIGTYKYDVHITGTYFESQSNIAPSLASGDSLENTYTAKQMSTYVTGSFNKQATGYAAVSDILWWSALVVCLFYALYIVYLQGGRFLSNSDLFIDVFVDGEFVERIHSKIEWLWPLRRVRIGTDSKSYVRLGDAASVSSRIKYAPAFTLGAVLLVAMSILFPWTDDCLMDFSLKVGGMVAGILVLLLVHRPFMPKSQDEFIVVYLDWTFQHWYETPAAGKESITPPYNIPAITVGDNSIEIRLL